METKKDSLLKLIEILKNNGIEEKNIDYVSIYNCAKEQLVHFYLNDDFVSKISNIEVIKRKIFLKENRRMITNSLGIITTLYNKDLNSNANFLVIKGPALSYLIYNDCFKRVYADIDIFVKKNEYLALCKMLENINFYNRFAFWYKDFANMNESKRMIVYRQLDNNQCAFSPIRNDYFEFEIKTKLRECSEDLSSYLVSETKKITVGEYEFKTLSVKNTFIFYLVNIYYQFMTKQGVKHKSKLKDLYDIFRFYEKYKEEIDIDKTLKTTERFKDYHKMIFSLKFVNLFFKIPFNFKCDFYDDYFSKIDRYRFLLDISYRLNYCMDYKNKFMIKNGENIVSANNVGIEFIFDNCSTNKNFIVNQFCVDLEPIPLKYDLFVKRNFLYMCIDVPEPIKEFTIEINFYSIASDESHKILVKNVKNSTIYKNFISKGTFQVLKMKKHKRFYFSVELEKIQFILDKNKYSSFTIKLYKNIEKDIVMLGTTDNELGNLIIKYDDLIHA